MRQAVSNVNVDRWPQPEKQNDAIVLIDEGIQIDSRDEQSANRKSLRIEIRQPGSNVNVERAWQLAKQQLAIVLIDEGTQIE
jgi:hypothetical protein